MLLSKAQLSSVIAKHSEREPAIQGLSNYYSIMPKVFYKGHSNTVQQKYRLLTVSLSAQKFFNFLFLPPFFFFPGFSLIFGAGHLPWIDHSNRIWNRLFNRLSISVFSITASSMKESIRFHR